MKKVKEFIGTLLTIIIAVVVVAAGIKLSSVDIIKDENLSSSYMADDINIIGSSSNFASLPKSAVEASATTTDSGGSYPDGGYTLQQEIITSGLDSVVLNIKAVGGTATSTMYIRQVGSFDGTNFFNIASSTDDLVGTSTVSIIPKAVEIVPGTATTTPGVSIPFNVKGYYSTRFIIWGTDLTTDPNDGVQAWITPVLIEGKSN